MTSPISWLCHTDVLLAQHLFKANHIYDDNGRRLSIDALLKGEHGETRWNPALSNEWGRLAQGNYNGVKSTDTIDFIPFTLVPKDKKTTYASFVCDHRPLKDE